MYLKIRDLFSLIVITGMIFSFANTHAKVQTDFGSFSQVVILGDSLSDNGNLFNGNTGWWVPVPTHFMPRPPYLNGRFSNGLVWSDIMAEDYTKKGIKTLNYAVGGSLINTHFGLYLPYTLGNEINRFFAIENPDQKLVEDSLFIIWIGANDYLQGVQYFSDANSDTDYAISTLTNNVDELIRAHANHIVIINLPDLSKTLYWDTPDKIETLHQLSTLHNEKLAKMVKQLKNRNNNLDIHLFDAHNLFEQLYKNQNEFNKKFNTHLHITNAKASCWSGGYRLSQPETATDKEAQIQKRLNAFLHTQGSVNLLYANEGLDTQALAHDIYTSPSLYQAYSVSYEVGKSCDSPDEYIFWDKVHPTTAIHRAIAQIIEDELGI